MAERAKRGGSKSGSEFAELLRQGKETYSAGEQYENMSFEKIPAGTYMVRVQLVEWRKSKNENLMLHREHVVLEGEFAGKMVFDNLMYGLSDYGDGKIRNYITTATGEPCPDDPADLETIVSDLNDKMAYDAKAKVSYSGEGDNQFTNVTVMEVYDVDDSIDVDKLKPAKEEKDAPADEKEEKEEKKEQPKGRSAKEEKKAEPSADEQLFQDALAFLEKNDPGFKEAKKKKVDLDDFDSIKAEIGEWTYDEADLSEEEEQLLIALDLEDTIERAKKGRSKR